MDTVYENIIALCEERGIKGGKMCTDLGISKGLLSDLKAGRKKGMSAANADKIASYFNVSVGHLLGTEQEKTPAPEGERTVTFDDFTYAMYEEGKELTEENKNRLLEMAQFFKQQQEKEKG